jgi:hypothetical protein
MPDENENLSESERIKREKLGELKYRRGKLRILLENEADKIDMDIDGLVRQYNIG